MRTSYVGRKATNPNSPAACVCGKRGQVINTGRAKEAAHKVRTYKCKCGKRWQTIEHRVNGKPQRGVPVAPRFDEQQARAIKRRIVEFLASET